jgi:hypothetical protein
LVAEYVHRVESRTLKVDWLTTYIGANLRPVNYLRQHRKPALRVPCDLLFEDRQKCKQDHNPSRSASETHHMTTLDSLATESNFTSAPTTISTTDPASNHCHDEKKKNSEYSVHSLIFSFHNDNPIVDSISQVIISKQPLSHCHCPVKNIPNVPKTRIVSSISSRQ